MDFVAPSGWFHEPGILLGEESEVRCPFCGHEWAHMAEMVELSEGEYPDPKQGGYRIAIDGECECPPATLLLVEHKGKVYLLWRMHNQHPYSREEGS